MAEFIKFPKSKQSGFQFKVTIKGSKPIIWRRFQMNENMTLAEFHEVLQIVFDWEEFHLHEFVCKGKIYSGDGEPGTLEDEDFTLKDLGLKKNSRLNDIR